MSIIGTHDDDDAQRFDCKIGKHIRDTHVIAAFTDMAMRGTAKLVLRDDGALLMIVRSEAEEEVLFKVTRTGLLCLARFGSLNAGDRENVRYWPLADMR